MSRVFWDTNLFIYLLEGSGPQSARVTEIRKRMLERDDELCTSIPGIQFLVPLERAFL